MMLDFQLWTVVKLSDQFRSGDCSTMSAEEILVGAVDGHLNRLTMRQAGG